MIRKEMIMQQIKIQKRKITSKPQDLDTRTPSGRPLPY
jgi:hypothetical protein